MADIHRLNVNEFAGLDKWALRRLFLDGRFASSVLNEVVPLLYPGLTKTDEPYVTFRDVNGNPYLLRMFTSTGLKFMPSKQIGVGRKFDIRETVSRGANLTVICAGANDFPNVWFSFIPFSTLIKNYPDAIVPTHDRNKIQELHD